MWTLRKRFTFEAAHRLPRHQGKCARLHGHSWGLVVECVGAVLGTEGSTTGMVLDYRDISAAVKPLLDTHLDHYYLNESLALEHPTSERVAEWIYTRLKPVLFGLQAVTIAETCTSECRYVPSE